MTNFNENATTMESTPPASSRSASPEPAAPFIMAARRRLITNYHNYNCGKTLTIIILLILCCFCNYNEGAWSSQCWKKHNSGSIQTPDGEFKRPFGILCTYRCFLWFPPIYPYCEFIFDLRLSRHFTTLQDCYEIRCNETFAFFD